MNRLTWLGAVAVAALAGCAGEARRRVGRMHESEPDIEPLEEEESPPLAGPLEGPVFDPDYPQATPVKEPPAPKAPVYFYHIDVPDPEGRLQRALTTACQRWARATGVRIEVGRGTDIGLRSGAETEHTVTWWPRDNAPLNGASGHANRDNWMATQIYIADDSNANDVGLANLLTHELGHSLGRRGDHAETGIMNTAFSSFEPTPINDESLTYVCERLICTVFNPES